MRRRRTKKHSPKYLTGGKFQHILQQKYGLKIEKDVLVKALASPSDTQQVLLERVTLQKPKLIVQEKPKKKVSGRHSHLHKLNIQRARSGS